MNTGSIFAIALGAVMVVLLVFSSDFGPDESNSLPVVTIESGSLNVDRAPSGD